MKNSILNNLKNTLGMGARNNKYRIIINGVGGGPSGGMVDTLAKSTSIPARSTNDIEIWYQGRLTTIAGEASFEGTWSVTFYDTEGHSLRRQFIKWMEYIDSPLEHNRGSNGHADYMSTAQVHQNSTISNGTAVVYEFDDLYPKSISESSLSDDSQEIMEFTVEFNYSTWKIV